MIIDITKEFFSTPPFPGDPYPIRKPVSSFDLDPDAICQVTQLTFGSHAGTHLDAPCHFVPGGKDVSELDLEKCYGDCKVTAYEGDVPAERIREWLSDGTKRLLIKGAAEITPEAAALFAESGLFTLGVEKNTVGNPSTSKAVHQALLGAEIVIIENLDLSQVQEGEYLLCALPLKMEKLDGSPVRAVLCTK